MLRFLSLAAAMILVLLPAPGAAQSAPPIKGDAILKHPLGALATKVVDLIAAGKYDEVMALRTKGDQTDWKAASAAEKKDFGDRMKTNAPSPSAFAEMVRAGGELTIEGETASLMATTPAGMMRQAFEREGGQWRVSFGPMFMANRGGAAAPAPVTRVEGAALASHPASAVVLQYVDLVHAGKIDEAIGKFGSTQAQAKWKALPAGEKKESSEFRRRILPRRAEIAKALQSGGVLLIEGEMATLNLIKMEPATAQNSKGSSTTVAIPLALENGAWKIAQ
jgi:hypothetical protein